MPLTDFRTRNYRSVRDVWLKLKRINVIVGPNGVGKSNLYRAMYLLASAANGRLPYCVAEEGGIRSLSWAGAVNKREIKTSIQDVVLSIKTELYRYDLRFGPNRTDAFVPSFFSNDLEIKLERISLLSAKGRKLLLERRKSAVSAWDGEGRKIDYTQTLRRNDSVLNSLRDPHRFKELSILRQELLDWRFYHQFRTDLDSPLRKPQFSVYTPIMSHDGRDVSTALATIMNLDEENNEVQELIDDAFPGSSIDFEEDAGRLKLLMRSPDVHRPLALKELSDGTLQYLCLLAALLSPSPPAVLALNEPETSIHSSLLEPLAKLIVRASKHSQIWITTHSQDLSDYILDMSGYEPLELKKVDGETKLVGVGLGGYKEEDEDDEDDMDEDEEA